MTMTNGIGLKNGELAEGEEKGFDDCRCDKDVNETTALLGVYNPSAICLNSKRTLLNRVLFTISSIYNRDAQIKQVHSCGW